MAESGLQFAGNSRVIRVNREERDIGIGRAMTGEMELRVVNG